MLFTRHLCRNYTDARCCGTVNLNKGSYLDRATLNTHCPAGSRRRSCTVVCSGKGFGSGPGKGTRASEPKNNEGNVGTGARSTSVGAKDKSQAQGPPKDGKPWIRVGDTSAFKGSRLTAPIILDTGRALMLYTYERKYYCSEAKSTAFEYPLTDAKINGTPSGPTAEVPFDGTTYELTTGKVTSWCPGSNPGRKVLSMLKGRDAPVDLRVYPVYVDTDNAIYVNLD